MNTLMHLPKLQNFRQIESIRQCPLCHYSQSNRLIDLEYALFDDSPIDSRMHLSACGHCGFVFYDTVSKEDDFRNFYSNHYFIHAYYSVSHDYQSDTECYSDIAQLLKNYGLSSTSRIVDVGCGKGQLIRSLKHYGFDNITGIELCQDYVKGLKAEGMEAYLGSALDMPIRKEEADLLIYKHIFEHFYDLHSAAKAAYEHIAPGGYLFVAVPDAAFYNSCKEYSSLHYLTIEHINHFDLHHIESLFGTYGLKLENSVTRMLDISEDYPVPIMSCLFSKPINPEAVELKPNFELAENMIHWLETSDSLSNKELENLQKSQREIFVWGLSYRTAMYLAMSPLKDCNIKAFIDIDPRKQEKTLLNKNVISPDILNSLNDDITIVIGVGPSSRAMMEQLRNQGFKGDIIRLL